MFKGWPIGQPLISCFGELLYKNSFKIEYPKDKVKIYIFVGIFLPMCFIAEFCIAIIPNRAYENYTIFENIIIISIMLILILTVSLIFLVSAAYCKKFCMTVSDGVIHIKSLRFENQYYYSDITNIICSYDIISTSYFSSKNQITAKIYFGKKKVKLNSSMCNYFKFMDLLIAKGYLKG